MKKVTLILVFLSSFCFSQNLTELEIQNELLKSQKKILLHKIDSIRKEINTIDNKIKQVDSKIVIQSLKRNAIKVKIKRDCKFYEKSSRFSRIIANPKSKNDIYIIEYDDKYQIYFKAIYNDKLGYINIENIKLSRSNKKLIPKKKSSTYSNINSSSLTPRKSNSYSKKRRSYSRTYYRGPRGGCYYINSNGNKSYVSRSMCN